jgi:hypothetical protein
LVDYQRRLTALNARQQRAVRVCAQGIPVKFVVSDFDDLDQGQTTATVRVDTASATLRERREPSQVQVSQTTFSSSAGTVESIDADSTLFSVYSPAGIPTGTFNMTLSTRVAVSLLTIDISAMSSTPAISVSVSANGLTWVPATKVILSGYRLNAWLPETPAKYIQITATPSHADNLGGATYTFGITDLSGTSVDYNMVSDVFFEPLTLEVQSTGVQLVGNVDPGLSYYLTLDDGIDAPTTAVVVPGTPIALPGIGKVSETAGNSSLGVLAAVLPSTFIPGTVAVVDPQGKELPVLPGLLTTDPNAAYLSTPHVSLVGSTLTIMPAPLTTGNQYTISFLTGSPVIVATLRVHLSTSDRTVTPIFSGAYLEDI